MQVDVNFESELPGIVAVPDGRIEQNGEDSLACARGTWRRARKARRERIVRRIARARGLINTARNAARVAGKFELRLCG